MQFDNFLHRLLSNLTPLPSPPRTPLPTEDEDVEGQMKVAIQRLKNLNPSVSTD